MKRLVWLLILVFGTALAQVSPVDLGVQSQKSCSCCEVPGACGMPDCNLPPSSAPAIFVAEKPARVASAVARGNAERSYRVAVNFLSLKGTVSLSVNRPIWETAVAQVPLFKAHCSFLI